MVWHLNCQVGTIFITMCHKNKRDVWNFFERNSDGIAIRCLLKFRNTSNLIGHIKAKHDNVLERDVLILPKITRKTVLSQTLLLVNVKQVVTFVSVPFFICRTLFQIPLNLFLRLNEQQLDVGCAIKQVPTYLLKTIRNQFN